MIKGNLNRIASLFMSLVVLFNFLSFDLLSISGYATTDVDSISHSQNLDEANFEGEEECRIQGNGSQCPLTTFVGRTDSVSLGDNGQKPYLSSSDNNWLLLRKYDHLNYNTIHIMVQNDIIGHNKNVNKELYLEYNQPDPQFPNGKKTGSADLWKIVDESTYCLWEVKPKSYLDVNKAKGEKQLNEYINRKKLQVDKETDNINSIIFKQGETNEASIENGNLYFLVYVVTPKCEEGYVEEIRYDVHYEAQSNGLVIYTFRRTSYGRKPRKQEQELYGCER